MPEQSDLVHGDYHCMHGIGISPMHNHTHYELSVVLHGSLRVINNSDVIDCEAPCVILHFPGTQHSVERVTDGCYERYNINFSAGLFRRSPMLLGDVERLFVSNVSLLRPDEAELEQLLFYIRPYLAAGREMRERLLPVIMQLLKGCRPYENKSPTRPAAGCVNRAISLISQQLSPAITASELAGELAISRAKLTSDFKRETGMTLKEYIELQCVERGKNELAAGKNVRETAQRLGYVDVGTFIRVFKKVTGETPGRFRRSCAMYGEDPIWQRS